MAQEMLTLGRAKAGRKNLSREVTFDVGDACQLPYTSNEFDLITISFGIRNVIDLDRALHEMHRVLRQNGRALILEFSLPNNMFIRRLYLFYFRKVLPRLGGVISGDYLAYRYLNETVETFPFGQEFCNLLQQAGFSNVKAVPVSFGIATIYVADKDGKLK